MKYALTFDDRAALYRRIDRRADEMAQAGLFDEVRALLEAGVPKDATAMQAIGYKEAAAALCGACTRAEALAQIQQASRRYAKRQLTWLRRDPGVRWVAMDRRTHIAAARWISTDFFGCLG